MRLPVLLSLACVCAPVLGVAQSSPPRLYVGAGASLLNIGLSRPYSYTTVGPALTVGVQLSPRWAIQTGAALGRKRLFNNFNRDSAAVTLGAYAFDDRITQLVVPLLARFTLTAPTSAFHVDLLAGGSWRHTFLNRNVRYVDLTRSNQDFSSGYTAESNAANAAAGLGLRYAVGPHLELTANALLNADFTTKYYQATLADRLILNSQVGVQYRFGK